MNLLVVDIGGTNVKLWRTDDTEKIKFPSGKEMTPDVMIEEIKKQLGDWKYDRISIGYPGKVVNGRPDQEPLNLGSGWVGFDYDKAFGAPVRIMNDACMQALGSYEGGRMLYIGLGTGMGTVFIIDGKIVPLALGHLKFLRGESFNHYLCSEGLELHGTRRWRKAVDGAAQTLKEAFHADYVILGGGNSKKLEDLPEGCRRGDNLMAFHGGLRMWDAAEQTNPQLSIYTVPPPSAQFG